MRYSGNRQLTIVSLHLLETTGILPYNAYLQSYK